MYQRGDRVLVEGVGGKRAVLRVWDVRRRGLALCSEAGFAELVQGRDAAIVGFPQSDVIGQVNEAGQPDAASVSQPAE